MSTRRVPLWKTLGAALKAPFTLQTASWKALVGPGIALVVSSLFLAAVDFFHWGTVAVWLALLPVWSAMVWLGLSFQRHLLLGSAAPESGPGPWRRYGVYLLAVLLLSVFLAVFLGILLYTVLPAAAWFLMALNSPTPWYATGLVVLWTLVAAIAVYPTLRLALTLPAVSVGHNISPRRIWRLSRHNGLRLVALLVLIPGLVNGFMYLVLRQDTASYSAPFLLALLETYLLFVFLSILALTYRILSDEPLPTIAPTTIPGRRPLGNRVLWPLMATALVALVGATAWEALYRVDTEEEVLISRFDRPARIEKEPGLHGKIPLVEEAQPISRTLEYRITGTGRFLTVSKDSLPLKYDTHWRVADREVFVKTTAGRTRLVDARIDELLTHILRHRIGRMTPDEVERLLRTDRVDFSFDAPSESTVGLTGVVEEINSRVIELGVEVTSWSIETANHGRRE